jgi:hypothetical protein
VSIIVCCMCIYMLHTRIHVPADDHLLSGEDGHHGDQRAERLCMLYAVCGMRYVVCGMWYVVCCMSYVGLQRCRGAVEEREEGRVEWRGDRGEGTLAGCWQASKYECIRVHSSVYLVDEYEVQQPNAVLDALLAVIQVLYQCMYGRCTYRHRDIETYRHIDI